MKAAFKKLLHLVCRYQKLKKVEKPIHGKIAIALQLRSMDKGGLEEVVLSLIKGFIQYNLFDVYLILEDAKLGYLGVQARDILGKSKVIELDHDIILLEQVIKKTCIKLVNTHYSVFGYKVFTRNGIRIVDTIHNNYIWLENEHNDFYANVSRFIAVSSQVKEHFSKRFHIDLNKITMVPNGIDVSNIKVEPIARSELGIMPGDFVFINVASFIYNKSHILIIEAFNELIKQHPNIKLILVGNVLDQVCFNQVNDMVRDYNLRDKVIILNYVPKTMVYGLLSISDCFVFPSLIEGWSIAVMEAMYMNLPLILSNIGSAGDVIENNDIGFIVANPYLDPVTFSNKDIYNKFRNIQNFSNLKSLVLSMQKCMNKNLKPYLESSNLSRDKVISKYNLLNFINNYQSVYQGALNEK